MLTSTEIEAFATRRYREVLAAIVTGEAKFPLRVPLGTWPSEDLAQMKSAGAALRAIERGTRGFGPTIQWGERNTRRFGLQPVPTSVEFTTQRDYLRFLGKEAEVAEFAQNVATTREQVAALVPWIARYSHRVVEKAAVWCDLLKVCVFFQNNPQPRCYPREVRLPIGTKFIENERAILRQLLDEVLPVAARTEVEDFYARFGLKVDEAAVRLRWLGAPPVGSPVTLPDFSAPVSVLAAESFRPVGIVVVENKTTFLTLPPLLPGWLALLGNGNSVTVCGGLPWMAECPVLYWGDIDSAGLQILARMRRCWPQTESIMMDRETLQAHERWWGVDSEVPEQFSGELTQEERQLYQYISSRAPKVRLEQERILQTWVDGVVLKLRERFAERA